MNHRTLSQTLLLIASLLAAACGAIISPSLPHNYTVGDTYGYDTRDGHAPVHVFYATNRAPCAAGDPALFSTRLCDQTAFGRMTTSVPYNHVIGEFDDPSHTRVDFVGDQQPLDQPAFMAALAQAVNRSRQKQITVVVHGYNRNFVNAVRAVGQLAYDLSLDGPILLFSWPSKGDWLDYPGDQQRLAASLAALDKLLEDLVAAKIAQRINLIGHSMGAPAIVDALAAQLKRRAPSSTPPYGHLLLMGCDADADGFGDRLSAIAPATERITLYISRRDLALAVVQALYQQKARAGKALGPVYVEGKIDTIDVTAAEESKTRHSYWLFNRNVITDMFLLLNHDLPPDQRNLARLEKDHIPYWAIRP